jgi:hypothetical protein
MPSTSLDEPTLGARPSALHGKDKKMLPDDQGSPSKHQVLFGVEVIVAEADADRLAAAAIVATKALEDQPALLTKLDAVERDKAANRRAIHGVLQTCIALLTTMDGKTVAHAGVRNLLDHAK